MANKISKNCLLYGLAEKLTEEQTEYANAIYSDNYDIIFCNAAAGTGKTTIAVAVAKLLVEEQKKDKLLYVFNPVEESKMGFRPGDQYEKEREYTMPLRNALIEVGEFPEKAIYNPYAEEPAVETKNKKSKEKVATNLFQWVETASHVFMRGTNHYNKVIIIDEAQNWTPSQLKKMLTRCHDSCKVIVIGHTGQIDLPAQEMSGFKSYIEHFKDCDRAKVCELTINFRGWMAQHADTLEAKY